MNRQILIASLVLLIPVLAIAALGDFATIYTNQFEVSTDCDATYWTAAGGGVFTPQNKSTPVWNGTGSCGASAGGGSNARYHDMNFNGDGNFTYTVMVRRGDTQSYDIRIATDGAYGDQVGVGLNTLTSSSNFSYFDGSWTASAVSFDTNIWYNTTFVYDSSNVLVLINGTQIANVTRANKDFSFIYMFSGGTDFYVDALEVMNDSVFDSVTLVSPPDSDHNNTYLIDFVYNPSNTFTSPTSCNLYINGTQENTSSSITPNANNTLQHTFSSDGTYTWVVGCLYGSGEINSTTRTITIDSVNPVINIHDSSIVANQMFGAASFTEDNLSATINFTDDNLYSINVSTDVGQIFYTSGITQTVYNLTISHNVSAYSLGMHYLNITTADGHTANEIKEYPLKQRTSSVKFDFKKDELFFEKDYVDVRVVDSGVSLDTEKRKDRYVFNTDSGSLSKSTLTFIVESDHKIDIVHEKYGYAGHLIIPTLNKWVDFEIEGKSGKETYKVTRLSSNAVQITVEGLNSKKVTFKSIGDLNVETLIVPFVVVNGTESFTSHVLENRTTNLSLQIDYGLLNFTIGTPAATIEIDDTNYSASLDINNASISSFSYLHTTPSLLNATNVTHRWYVNYTNLTPDLLISNPAEQRYYSTQLGICDANRTHYVLNMSYFDESDDSPINLTNSFSMSTTDSKRTTDHSIAFSGNESDQICSYVNPSFITVNWDLYGTLTMNKTNYVTRVYDIDSLSPVSISNNPIEQLDLYLIPINGSTTVSYNWITTNFQEIDGTMKVYKCNPDGSQDLVESVPIINGNAAANIELFTQLYSYQVVIDDTIYTDSSAWTRCHVESETSLSFTVDVDPINVNEILGLKGIECFLEETGNNTVTMTWANNPENTEDDIYGCIVATRATVTGPVEVYNNCTVEEDFTRTVIIPSNGNNYYVAGKLVQNGYTASCGDVVSFLAAEQDGGVFGLTGLFATFMLLMTLVLVFSVSVEIQAVAMGIGLVASFLLGIFSGTWELVITMLGILLLGLIVGRYSRK